MLVTYVCRGLGRLLGPEKILDIGHWDHQVAICGETRGGLLVYGPKCPRTMMEVNGRVY